MIECAAGDDHGGLVARFEEIVRSRPHDPAIAWPGGVWSYAHLNRAANRLARRIRGGLPEPGVPVAMVIGPSPWLSLALLAVWKVGGVALPLDPTHPSGRLRELCEAAGAHLVLASHADRAAALPLATDGRALLLVDEDSGASTDDLSLPLAGAAPTDICYTSGSTGAPKGVFHTQASRWVNARNVINDFGLRASDRIAALSRPGVASAVSEVLAGLLAGATLCPIDFQALGPEKALARLRELRITVLYWTPSALRSLLAGSTHARLDDVRLVVLGSEPVTRKDLELVRARCGAGTQVANRYGLTETGNLCAYFVDPERALDETSLPVGRASRDRELRLVSERGDPVPDGDSGEIVVRSRYLAGGYWRRPDLTAAAFLPVAGDPSFREYRTGDLGRLRPDGTLEHLGRRDQEVKIRGHRVNLTGLEALLSLFPGVRTAVAAVLPSSGDDEQLLAYVEPENDAEVDARDARRFLAQRLPPAHVPARIIALASLPRTAGGKVDRSRLPVPEPERHSADHDPPNEREARLIELWREALGGDEIGVDDDFFDLGCDSIRATVFLNRVQAEFETRLPSGLLFEVACIRSLARYLRPGDLLDMSPAEEAELATSVQTE